MDSPQVRRAYKLRAYPTRPQETRAKGLLHDHCDLYNAALQERRDALIDVGANRHVIPGRIPRTGQFGRVSPRIASGIDEPLGGVHRIARAGAQLPQQLPHA